MASRASRSRPPQRAMRANHVDASAAAVAAMKSAPARMAPERRRTARARASCAAAPVTRHGSVAVRVASSTRAAEMCASAMPVAGPATSSATARWIQPTRAVASDASVSCEPVTTVGSRATRRVSAHRPIPRPGRYGDAAPGRRGRAMRAATPAMRHGTALRGPASRRRTTAPHTPHRSHPSTPGRPWYQPMRRPKPSATAIRTPTARPVNAAAVAAAVAAIAAPVVVPTASTVSATVTRATAPATAIAARPPCAAAA